MVTHKLPGFFETVLQHSGLPHCRVFVAPDGILGQSARTGSYWRLDRGFGVGYSAAVNSSQLSDPSGLGS